MITARGWWFLLASGALLVVGLAANNTSLALIALTLLGWFGWSLAYFVVQVQRHLGRLSLGREVRDERGPVQSLWADRAFTVHVRVGSAAAATSAYLRAADRVPYGAAQAGGESSAEGAVGGGAALGFSYHLQCGSAGLLRFEGVQVQSADPQGFFYHRQFVRAPAVYRVLPALLDVRTHMPTVKQHNLLPLLGTHRFRRPGSGSELLDLRDYMPGDPPKTIAWKVSARRDRLMTKEFESEVPLRITFFIDTSSSVRVGTPGGNALAQLADLAAAVSQAAATARDLSGVCLFDESGVRHSLRPARSSRHQTEVLNLLARVAALPPAPADVPVRSLLRLAYSFAGEVYPDLLAADVNRFPWWLPFWAPPAAATVPENRAFAPARNPAAWLWRWWRWLGLELRQAVAGRLGGRRRQEFRWRKQLAALLSARYGLQPGGLAHLLEDDPAFARCLQRFLAEHHVPYEVPLYGPRGEYLFAAPGKVGVLAAALLQAVRRGKDNELFVLMADLLDLDEQLGPLVRAIKVAAARHHRVILLCPWPPGVPPPGGGEDGAGELAAVLAASGTPELVREATALRLRRAYRHLRRTFGRLGIPVVCAGGDDSVRLIVDRLQRLRLQGRGAR